MSGRVEVVVLDVNETLSDLTPLRARFGDVGAPEHLLDTWFAAVLRDGFALAAAGRAQPFPAIGAAVLRGLLSGRDLTRRLDDAVEHVLDGIPRLDVHPDVPAGVRALADGGLRVVTLTNGSLPQSEQLLERAGVADLVEQRLSVDDAGRWKPHPDAYAYAARTCGVPLERCAMVAVHPWDLMGARAVGMATGRVDRTGTPWPDVFDRPDVTGRHLTEVAEALLAR
ncbi:MAG TPA: haloacid dehalogenase type II [Mycobacteriales bacterium]|nr:haloacid dehalogenase type II [Mycobacteriales bacterium]